MRTLTMAAALLGLAQCAPPEAAVAPAAPAEGARDCIDLGAVTSRTAEDERTIRFDLIGGAVFRNRLAGRCPGLEQIARGFGTLAFDVQGSRLCRGDLVRVIDATRAGGGYGGAVPCVLGDFVPVQPTEPR